MECIDSLDVLARSLKLHAHPKRCGVENIGAESAGVELLETNGDGLSVFRPMRPLRIN